jgi:hypothetical protein
LAGGTEYIKDFIGPYTFKGRLLASCPGDRDDPEITVACDA